MKKGVLVVGLLLQTLQITTAWSNQGHNTAPPRASLDVPIKLQQLKAEGEKLVKAIVAKDVDAILRFFDEGGVAVGFHYHLSQPQIENQLRFRKGIIYATFFDTPQLRRFKSGVVVETEETERPVKLEEEIRSLYDHFVEAKRVVVEVEDRMTPISAEDALRVPLWGRLIFRWEQRPPSGVYYDPIFIYTEKGWKISTFFNHP